MTGSSLDRLAKRAQASPMVGGRELEIPMSKIRFDVSQPRTAYSHIDGRVEPKDEAYIVELAATIKERGLIQAITVQEMPDGTYLVVVGECRSRAHLLLNAPTIRAVVRNDLLHKGERLLYQLAENVNRQDLTDDELAKSVRLLMEGSEGVEPMSQVNIANTLGKAEGWVSRLVRFGDVELQRLWVKSGIVDSVEHLYRVSILPKSIQVDIQRRVELPPTDPEFLKKPLDRRFIEEAAREAKISKLAAKSGVVPTVAPTLAPVLPAASSPVADLPISGAVPKTDDALVIDSGDGWTHSLNGKVVDVPDPVGAALGQSVVESTATLTESSVGLDAVVVAPVVPPSLVTDHYVLPKGDLANILGSAMPAPGAVDEHTVAAVLPNVNCRVSLASVVSLLDVLSKTDVSLNVDTVLCDVFFPASLAQAIADHLAGIVVDRRDVPAVMQRELAKLT